MTVIPVMSFMIYPKVKVTGQMVLSDMACKCISNRRVCITVHKHLIKIAFLTILEPYLDFCQWIIDLLL